MGVRSAATAPLVDDARVAFTGISRVPSYYTRPIITGIIIVIVANVTIIRYVVVELS
jgi:hypothetical protein